MADYDSGAPQQVLAFDLRQTFAKVLSIYMLEILEAKQTNNYSRWFKNMQLMFPVIASRVKKNRNTLGKEYADLKRTVLKYISSNREVYLGKSHDAKGVSEVEDALMEMEYFLLSKMEKNNMFGTNYDNVGLQ